MMDRTWVSPSPKRLRRWTSMFKIQLKFGKFIMNRPVALVCYICGREFGTKSLAIHLKACEKKWENEQNLKPPKERRPCPRPPAQLSGLLAKDNITKADMNQLNAKSYDTYVEDALIECEYCQRRFNPKSLIPHQKACKIKPMIKKVFVNKGPMGKLEEAPIRTSGYAFSGEAEKQEAGNLEGCRKCGRTFAADRVAKHEKVCKADPIASSKAPAKKVQSKPEPSKMKPNFAKEKKPQWKIQHEQLQNAMQQMRQMKAIEAKGGKLSDLPPPPRSNYDHYTDCPYCGRKYAPDVAERHIPKCANIINKPGGIKPSRIQEKYVNGTGTGKSQVYGGQQQNYGNVGKPSIGNPSKPNYGTDSGGGNAFKGSVQASGYGRSAVQEKKGSQLGEKGLGSPFGEGLKPSTNSKQPLKAPTSSYDTAGSSLKPSLKNNGKINANRPW